MLKENLQKLGFSPNEITLYLALIHGGQMRAGALIKETSLQRSVVYTALESLLQRGLVGKSVYQGVALYTANDPSALVDEADQRIFLAKKVAAELKETKHLAHREVVVYEGEGIVKRVADKSLEAASGATVYFLGPSKFGVQANLERYWQIYHKKRAEKKIHCKLLYDKSTDRTIVNERNTLALCEARFLPFDTEMPMSFIITDDMVGMVVPSENPPLAFVIKSAKTAEALKKYFEYVWEDSVPL